MALDEGRVVRTAVALADGSGLSNLGSGYLIADGLVLTAAHVLETVTGVAAQEGDAAEVARIGGEWLSATVRWLDTGRDVAVLASATLGATPPVRWGRLTGADPLDWGAIGFPAASVDAVAGRQPEHAYGRVSPVSDRPAGRLALTVESRQPVKGDSPWGGLSGSAVFCGDH